MDCGDCPAPSLRRHYPDQVQRVAGYSALNLRLRDRLPGESGNLVLRNQKV